VGGRRLYHGSENRCSNAPPRDYVQQARALSCRVIIRGAIICDGDDEENGQKWGSLRPRNGREWGIMNERMGRSFPYRCMLTDT
jgi:hypothetical protein